MALKTYRGHEWSVWQQVYDEKLSASDKKLLQDYALLTNKTDAESILRHVANVIVDHGGVSGLVAYMTSLIDTEVDKKFELYRNDFDIWSKQVGYDKEYWDADDFAALKKVFKEQLLLRPDDPGMAISNVERVVYNDTTAKHEEGSLDTDGNRVEGWSFDPDTGESTEVDIDTGEPLEKGTSKWERDLDRIFSDMGLDKEEFKSFYDHLLGELKKGDITTYQAEQLIRADPEFIEQEYRKDFDEWMDKLPGFQQEELGLIDKEGERLRTEQERVFKEDVAPTIRREVGLLGGRGREFHPAALAEAAKEMETMRGDYMSKLRLGVEFADIERRRMAEAGKFEDIQDISAFGGEQGLKAQERILTQRMKTLETLTTLSMAKSEMLSMRASERYSRDLIKETKRLQREEGDRIKAASKKSRRMGMFANVFQGIAMAGLAAATGGASIPWTLAAMGAGGLAGYGTGMMQQQGAQVSAPGYFSMGRAFGGYSQRTQGYTGGFRMRDSLNLPQFQRT